MFVVYGQVLSSYLNPGEQWPPEESSVERAAAEEPDEALSADLPQEFVDLLAASSLVPAICSYLRNDSGQWPGAMSWRV